jgi:hypothetical protein
MTFRTKTTAIFALSAILLLAASPALAGNWQGKQDRNTPRPTIKMPVRANIHESIASKSQEFKKDMKERLTEKRRTQLREWWTRASKRLTNIVNRLNKVADKIATRNPNPQDLAAARAKITIASQSIASASAQIDGILTSNTPADAFRKLHDLQSGVIAKIRDAHKALVTLLASLRNVAP